MTENGCELDQKVHESDTLHDLPCSPYEKDGKNTLGVQYCVDCDENLCSSCLKLHNTFATTREHELLGETQKCKEQKKRNPSWRCSKHGGKIIDIFCPTHDTVGCSTCVAVDHSSCKGIQFIPDVSVGVKASKNLTLQEARMEVLKSKLESLNKLKRDNLQRLKQDKDELIRQIQDTRKIINDQLDKMVAELVDEAEVKFKQNIEAIEHRIAETDSALAKVKKALEYMKSDKDDSDIFVSCKVVNREISDEIEPMMKIIMEVERSFELRIDSNAKQIMKGRRMFAAIKEKYSTQELEQLDELNIRMPEDKSKCRVYSMCLLRDGSLVIADFSNMKLKKLDPDSNNVSTMIKLPDNPFGLCPVGKSRIAVSLFHQKKVQFIILDLDGKVTMDQSFSVGDRCRGLAFSDGLFYVCCGGSHNEGRGRVEIYNYYGELLRCFYQEIGCPKYISVIRDRFDTNIYLSDYYSGMQIRDARGIVKHRFPTVLGSNLPFCLIGSDQICVGEYITGDVFVQSCDCRRNHYMKNFDSDKLFCLYFDVRTSRLLVGLDDYDAVAVFDLKCKNENSDIY